MTCVPINSAGGTAYYNAMACTANFAWANRQVLLHIARDVFMDTLGISPWDLGMHLVYEFIIKKSRFQTNANK